MVYSEFGNCFYFSSGIRRWGLRVMLNHPLLFRLLLQLMSRFWLNPGVLLKAIGWPSTMLGFWQILISSLGMRHFPSLDLAPLTISATRFGMVRLRIGMPWSASGSSAYSTTWGVIRRITISSWPRVHWPHLRVASILGKSCLRLLTCLDFTLLWILCLLLQLGTQHLRLVIDTLDKDWELCCL